MYTTIKGGEKAIAASHRILSERRRGDRSIAALSVAQIREQLSLAVDRVMCEGSLYDRTLAALAIKQAQGDLVEAAFLIRAFRTTLQRFGDARPIRSSRMTVRRRIVTTHKDVPGGQILGPTYDYTHRLLDFSLMRDGDADAPVAADGLPAREAAETPPDTAFLSQPVGALADAEILEQDLPTSEDDQVFDLTREPLSLPAGRDQRLQNLARGDEGFLLGLAYSTMRGYGRNHPFLGELRVGEVVVEIEIPELDIVVGIAEITVTECKTTHQPSRQPDNAPQFTRGYGLCFGGSERKALTMALMDRALRARELGETTAYPAQDEEFVLLHSDNIAASGLVQHLKLPHYVDYQAELQLLRQLRAEHQAAREKEAS